MNESPWTITFYRDPRGRSPVEELIRSLSHQLQAKVLRDLEVLATFGPALSMPLNRPVAGFRFSELRSQSGGDIVRTFYFAATGRQIVILHAFAKKTQRIPRAELNVAAGRREEYLRNSP